jgi:hypothetical protein
MVRIKSAAVLQMSAVKRRENGGQMIERASGARHTDEFLFGRAIQYAVTDHRN